MDKSKYRMFHLWTEFNAKAKGYFFVRKYSFKDMYDESQVPYIMQTELPYQIEDMTNEYSSTDDADKQLYAVTHFLAKLFILEELFPKHFNMAVLSHVFASNDWMQKLYSFYKNHTTLIEAHLDFEVMRQIIQENFPGA